MNLHVIIVCDGQQPWRSPPHSTVVYMHSPSPLRRGFSGEIGLGRALGPGHTHALLGDLSAPLGCLGS